MTNKFFFTKNQSAIILLILLALLITLQVGVIYGYVPSEWFWGGRAKAGQLPYLSIISIAILAYAAWVTAIAGSIIKTTKKNTRPQYVVISLWFFVVYLVLTHIMQ